MLEKNDLKMLFLKGGTVDLSNAASDVNATEVINSFAITNVLHMTAVGLL